MVVNLILILNGVLKIIRDFFFLVCNIYQELLKLTKKDS